MYRLAYKIERQPAKQQQNRAIAQEYPISLLGFHRRNELHTRDQEPDRNLLTRLSNCSFIERNENIIATRCTVTGKSFLATERGYQYCIKSHKVLYYNLGKLFDKLMMGEDDGSYMRELRRIENCDLLIIDGFGLQDINNEK